MKNKTNKSKNKTNKFTNKAYKVQQPQQINDSDDNQEIH
jgi:hypothetical protein